MPIPIMSPAEPEPPKKSTKWPIVLICLLFFGTIIFLFCPRPRLVQVACSQAGQLQTPCKAGKQIVWENSPLIQQFLLKSGCYLPQPLGPMHSVIITSPSPDPTANWKTYTNNALGISFKHPSDWVITETDTRVVLLKNPDLRTVVGACPEYSFSVSKYDPYLNYSRFDQVVKSELNGVSTEVWTNNDSKCKEKVIFVNSLPSETQKPKYIISFISKNSDSDKTFDLILSTFKFIDSADQAQAKTNCQTPRPVVCTLECIQNPPYICGSDGNNYCSICQACANQNVAWYEMKSSACKKSCGECPQLTPPAPDFCKNGKIISGGVNECGCSLGPDCLLE